MGHEPRNRAERRAALRKARRVAARAITAGGAALGATAGLFAGPAAAATVTVDTLADGNDGECVVDCTLREAIDTAAANDTVDFSVTGTITLLGAYGGQLDIDKNLTISGPGATNLEVDGNNNERVFYIYQSASNLDVTISGITIQNGDDGNGAGILNQGENLTLTSAVVTGNDASNVGGGVAVFYSGGTAGTLTVNGSSTFSDNYAEADGGAIYVADSDSVLDISGTTLIDNNDAGDSGGGIYLDSGTLTIAGATTISDNGASSGDGGGLLMYDTGGVASITGATITGNTAAGNGGGIYLYDPDFDIVITNTTVSDNTAGNDGGGIYLYSFDNGGLSITGSTISGNTATGGDGGGIYMYSPSGDVTIRTTTISSNHAPSGDGGAIFLDEQDGSDATFLIEGSTISGNDAANIGGGVVLYEIDGVLQIANTTITGNTAGGLGGGIYMYDTDNTYERTIRNTTISGNTAGGGGGGVAMLAIEDNVSFFNSTISGNTAAEGGAFYIDELGNSVGVDLVQTTITDNHVTAGGTTGGIYLTDLGSASRAASRSDLDANEPKDRKDATEKAAEGKAPKADDDPDDGPSASATAGVDQLALTGTIVSANDGLDIGGSTAGADAVISDHSLIGTVVGGGDLTDVGGTIFSTNPGLGALANNGGPTRTHALLGASAAIDTGPTTLTAFTGNQYDQRGPGFARVINGRVDIGAYEAPLQFADFTG